jgi:hypothetical protein
MLGCYALGLRLSSACSDSLRAALEADAPLELLLMPGLAFSEGGRRCGRGGGYYDKLLARLGRRAQQRGWAPPLLGACARSLPFLDRAFMEQSVRGLGVCMQTACC